MQAEKQMPVRCMGIFPALCIILFMGCTTQGDSVEELQVEHSMWTLPSHYLGGLPVQMSRYMRVRCRPDAFSSACLEEQGAPAIPDRAANMALPPKADPVRMKKFQDDPDISALSEDTYGSGNEMELESGSGMDDSVDGLIVPHFIMHQPGKDLELRLTDEGFFLQNQQL